MNEIRCPNCGKVFQVDEAGYAAIVSQVHNDIPDSFMAVTGKKKQSGRTQLVRHDQDRVFADAFHTAPETAHQRPGGDQLIPVVQGDPAAEQHRPDQQIMLFHRKERAFLDERMKHTVAQLFNCMQRRAERTAGGVAVLVSKE